MLRYVLRRLLLVPVMVLGISILSFGIMHLAPGGPASLASDLNPKVTAEARARLDAYYGLDKPLHVQYLRWLSRVVRFDFGESFAPDGRKVWDKIRERIPVTLSINLLSEALVFLLAVPLGLYAAVRRGSAFDRATTVGVFVGFAMPGFWLSLLLMILFGVKLGWLPISGLTSLEYDELPALGKAADLARHLALPVFVGAFGGMAGLSRFMRSSMLEAIRQDYVATARAKGLSERAVIWRHALRNALLPVITILGLSVPGLLGGSVILESIFAIPGLGQLFYQGVMSRDYPLILAELVLVTVLTLLGNLMADVGYAAADPRIRSGE